MDELKPCPFCGSVSHLNFQFRQARGSRRGEYDASIYCRKCGAYGARVKSREIKMPLLDARNEVPNSNYKDAMRKEALIRWNRRPYGNE